jgi:hypothetical protein
MEDEAALLEMYKVQVARSEHYERLRASVGQTGVAMASALVALASFDGTYTASDSLSGVALIGTGVLGAISSRRHSNRSYRHGKRAQAYRDALDRRLPNAGINVERDEAPTASTNLYRVWEAIHIFVALMGAIIVVLGRLWP